MWERLEKLANTYKRTNKLLKTKVEDHILTYGAFLVTAGLSINSNDKYEGVNRR